MNLKIGLGGGCHWCTEAVFASLKGVNKVEQGFIKSAPPFENYSEAVIVMFDDKIISLQNLINIHLQTHSSTSTHFLRSKYRSAAYYFTEKEKLEIEDVFNMLQPEFKLPIITKLLPFVDFKPSSLQYQNYYYKDTQKPFCKLYIQPKIQILKHTFSKIINENIE